MITDQEAFNICMRGTLSELEQLIASGYSASKSSVCFAGNTLLHLAAYNRDLDKLKVLIKSIPPEYRITALNKINKYNLTPLYEACLVPVSPRSFQEQHPNVDLSAYEQKYQDTMYKSLDVALYLLQNRADPNTPRAKIGGAEQANGRNIAMTLQEYINWQLSMRNRHNSIFEPLSTLKAMLENQIALNSKKNKA